MVGVCAILLHEDKGGYFKADGASFLPQNLCLSDHDNAGSSHVPATFLTLQLRLYVCDVTTQCDALAVNHSGSTREGLWTGPMEWQILCCCLTAVAQDGDEPLLLLQ